MYCTNNSQCVLEILLILVRDAVQLFIQVLETSTLNFMLMKAWRKCLPGFTN